MRAMGPGGSGARSADYGAIPGVVLRCDKPLPVQVAGVAKATAAAYNETTRQAGHGVAPPQAREART